MLFQHLLGYSQQTCILAGDRNLSIYKDLVPDQTISYCGGYPWSCNFNLDINGDGNDDYNFTVIAILSGWGGRYYYKMEGIGSNKISINPDHLSAPDTLKINDLICSEATWLASGYFYHDNYGTYDSTGWLNTTNKYVGVRMESDRGFALGWIKIRISGGIIIDNYASEIFPPESGIFGYPNPTNEFINIYVTNDNSSPYTLQLYNSRGDVVYENYGNDKKIDVHAMPAGIYVLRLITKDQTSSQKIVITSK